VDNPKRKIRRERGGVKGTRLMTAVALRQGKTKNLGADNTVKSHGAKRIKGSTRESAS